MKNMSCSAFQRYINHYIKTGNVKIDKKKKDSLKFGRTRKNITRVAEVQG